MMLLLLQQLLGVVSIAEARQNIIDIATGLGFNATSWQSGSIQRTFLEIFARVYAMLTMGISQIASGGYLDLAEDTWLHLLADSHYDNQVHLAVATQGTIVLTAAPLAPPATISADDLVASTESDITFRNKTGGTLNPGGTLELMFEAEVAGAGGNVAPNTITILKTALAGVTISNPILPAGTSWITRDGADIETNEQLRTRSRSKWATLGIGPGMAYVHNCRQAHESVKRVFVDATNPHGPGTLHIYLAGDSGEVSQTVVDLVEDYLTAVVDGIDRVNTTAIMSISSAAAFNVAISANVFILKTFDTPENRAIIIQARDDYVKRIPIGGDKLSDDDGPGFILINAFGSSMIRSVTGVQNVQFTSHQADIQVPANQVPVPTFTFYFYPV